MPREPILIGLDDSPIIIQAKGVDWVFNSDPSADFVVKMMDVAKSLQAEEVEELGNIAPLLESQLIEPDQAKLWQKAEMGVGFASAILFAYLEAVTDFPTAPSSESGTPDDETGPK